VSDASERDKATPAGDDAAAPQANASSEAVAKDPAAMAKAAMERARASARQRGARQTQAGRARAQRAEARRGTQPFTPGRDPQPMSDAVETLLRRQGWTEQVEVAAVTARWREVIGDQIADRCEPVGFEDGKLVVRASSTAWATQLKLMSGQLRHRINEEFGREIVTELTVLGPAARSWVKGPRTVPGRGPRDTYG